MFNDATTNRLRYPIRGRVIVFTTSTLVEFLDNALRYSYPLYSNVNIPEGCGQVFMVELDGYLTFDPGSYVKMSAEFNGFQQAYFDPTAVQVVRSASYVSQLVARILTATNYGYVNLQNGQGKNGDAVLITWTDGTSKWYLFSATYNDYNAQLAGLSAAQLASYQCLPLPGRPAELDAGTSN